MRLRHRVLLLLVLVVLPVAAQGNNRYTAPDDRYSLPIPDGWTAEQLGDTAVLTAPDSATVMWLALEANDADSGGQAALEQLVPDFVGMPVGRDEFPGATGVWIQQVYVNFTSGEIVVTLTLHARGTAYVALIGPMDE